MRLRALLSLAGIATLVAAPSASAATFTVQSAFDGAQSCSGTVCTTLRAAVNQAQLSAGPDTIKLTGNTQYNLTSGELAVSTDLTIVGASAATTFINHDKT